MNYYYDLHIHTALSPCADEDMTPNNIVNMALLKGLNFIAVTDHNTVGNVQSVIECAQGKDIVVIPGMEIESGEEVHLLCFFPTVVAAYEMQEYVYNHLPNIQNRSDIFGSQILYNKMDEMIGHESRLLLTATSLPLERIKCKVEALGGITIPSHIDRKSFSVISNLGFIPEEMNFTTVEVSKCADINRLLQDNSYLKKYRILCNSDAHRLWDISEALYFLELGDKSIISFLSALKGKMY